MVGTPTEEKDFWLFGPIDEPVKSCSGVTGKETVGSAFTIEEGPVGEVGLLRRITGGLVITIHPMTEVATIHYLWLMSRSSFFTAKAHRTLIDS